MTLAQSIGLVAPYYNLFFVLVTVFLFLKLFSLKNKKIYLKPWAFLFYAVLIYIFEEIATVLDKLGIIAWPRIFNAVLEFFIIILFIYLLLLQKDSIKNAK